MTSLPLGGSTNVFGQHHTNILTDLPYPQWFVETSAIDVKKKKKKEFPDQKYSKFSQ